jgi:hypothetical protein
MLLVMVVVVAVVVVVSCVCSESFVKDVQNSVPQLSQDNFTGIVSFHDFNY